jgi:DNA-directed RNA polymerase specialized sigma subunit
MVDYTKDMALWHAWSRMRSDSNLYNLLVQLDPLIQSEVNRWAGSLARPLLELEAKKLAIDAITSFSPTGGASLGSHVMNSLKRLSRLVYTHQNIGRIPEHQVLKLQSYNVAINNLKDQLGRDPTTEEIGEDLRWSKPYLSRFQKSLRKEYVESGDTPPIFDTNSGSSGTIDFVYNDLPTLHKKIFEHTTGYGGAKILDNQALMKKLHLTQGQYSYQKKQLVDKVEKTLHGEKD